jgi:hypothetical protein
MTQAQLERAVARSTGETLRNIRQHGFRELVESGDDLEPEDLVLQVDCPFCGGQIALPADWPTTVGCDRCEIEFDLETDDIYPERTLAPATACCAA